MQLADDLLGVTDALMNRSRKRALVKIYRGLRGVAQKQVAIAVPGIARIVVKHAG